MVKLKIRRVGNSLTVTIPADVAQHLHVSEGDDLFFVEQPQGYGVTPYDPNFAAKMEAAKRLAAKYRETLKALA